MPDILHLIKIHASPEQVYQALTTAEGIRNWWTRDAILDSRIGGAGEFRFYEGRSVTKVRVDEHKPPVRVGWKTICANAPGDWAGTTITFDLRAEGDKTVLFFAHRGFEQARASTGWAYYLVSLQQQYLETGKGAPHPDVDFARVTEVRESPSMTLVSLGENAKLTALPSERNQIWRFYRDVLECPVTKESDAVGVFRIGTKFYVGVLYSDSALNVTDHLKSIWMELRTAYPGELKQNILNFGIKEIEYFDKEHFYFQAPGGQVFRLVGTAEDVSNWQGQSQTASLKAGEVEMSEKRL